MTGSTFSKSTAFEEKKHSHTLSTSFFFVTWTDCRRYDTTTKRDRVEGDLTGAVLEMVHVQDESTAHTQRPVL